VELLARLAEDPPSAAIFLDVDGVLAPIVPRPEAARVPEATRSELRRLAERYALVACVSGRGGADAQAIVGVPELTYVGNHGLELEPEAGEWTQQLGALLAGVAWPRVENKGLTAALHYRDMDEADARRKLDAIAAQARAGGFVARYGRKVLEIVSPLEANKGTAVRRLLDECGAQRALYAGDDTTDLDAFAALEPLELGVRVAVASAEGPPELTEQADIVLGAQSDVLGLLRAL
jgi:trehalose 6-phosphate phosphatase